MVYKDVDSILGGNDFEGEIRRLLGESDAVLVVIGPRWIDELVARAGSGEEDFVRLEVRLALERGLPIIPVLVDEAKMPDAKDLPDDLVGFQRVNALTVRFDPDFDRDFESIREHLEPSKLERIRDAAGLVWASPLRVHPRDAHRRLQPRGVSCAPA